jgi:hypothetical protein
MAHASTLTQVDATLGPHFYKTVTPGDAAAVSRIWTSSWNSSAEVETKVREWPETRIYLKSPMVYFIYFDSSRIVRDYSCLEN